MQPFEELLSLEPTYSSQKVVSQNNLDLVSDIGVYEIHEAFAGQILSNLVAMNSQQFADDNLMETSLWPFGATG